MHALDDPIAPGFGSLRLTLTPEPGWTHPPIVRLRECLKRLLRSLGLRCQRIELDGDCEVQQ